MTRTRKRPGDHTLRKRVGRYSWFDREITTYHAPRPYIIAVDAEFRMLLACAERGCNVLAIR